MPTPLETLRTLLSFKDATKKEITTQLQQAADVTKISDLFQTNIYEDKAGKSALLKLALQKNPNGIAPLLNHLNSEHRIKALNAVRTWTDMPPEHMQTLEALLTVTEKLCLTPAPETVEETHVADEKPLTTSKPILADTPIPTIYVSSRMFFGKKEKQDALNHLMRKIMADTDPTTLKADITAYFQELTRVRRLLPNRISHFFFPKDNDTSTHSCEKFIEALHKGENKSLRDKLKTLFPEQDFDYPGKTKESIDKIVMEALQANPTVTKKA